MRMVFGLVLLLGLGLAGFAVHMARGYVSSQEARLQSEIANRAEVVPTTDVVVTTAAIRYGDTLAREDIRIVRWPVEGVPAGAYTDIAALFPEGGDPRTVLRAMEPGEAILTMKVSKPGEAAGVSSKLAPGMRAFALRVDVSSGVSGFLRPGDRVDVYWTGNGANDAAGAREFTQMIQAGMKIIAIDQVADEDLENPMVARTVTVEVTPPQVAALAQAQATGRLQLSLVGAKDDEIAEFVQVDQDALLGIERQQVAVVEAPRVCSIRTRRGGEMLAVEIPCTN